MAKCTSGVHLTIHVATWMTILVIVANFVIHVVLDDSGSRPPSTVAV